MFAWKQWKNLGEGNTWFIWMFFLNTGVQYRKTIGSSKSTTNFQSLARFWGPYFKNHFQCLPRFLMFFCVHPNFPNCCGINPRLQRLLQHPEADDLLDSWIGRSSSRTCWKWLTSKIPKLAGIHYKIKHMSLCVYTVYLFPNINQKVILLKPSRVWFVRPNSLGPLGSPRRTKDCPHCLPSPAGNPILIWNYEK